MAAQVRSKIDLPQPASQPGTAQPAPQRPVLRLVPPLETMPRPPHAEPRRAPAARRRPRIRFRLPVSFLIGLSVFAAVVGVGFLAGSMAGGAVPERTAIVWVQPGETVWDVAKRSAPGYDTEAVVAKIRAMNEIPADGVLAGQALEVPSAP
ncbi:LysM peptidoglycan-binding domain-containing protein [Actinocrispum sp. NPDC049592]|uniref:LysM peptidoglycan-binding domain-containing protein n=1 Tax=Actinocrispum sp. NPDC049592 TaxID=3154835 RepID=UPI00341A3B2F